MLVNPPICLLVIACVYLLIAGDRRTARLASFDLPGAILVTAGMLLLVYSLVKAPDVGWGTTRTIGGLAGALALLAVFLLNERRRPDPLLSLSLFRIKGLAAADITQLIAMAGFTVLFFFITLYMESVLGYSPLQTGLAYLPLCVGVGIASGVAGQLISRVGTRALIVAGLLITAAGLYLLSRVPVDGSYLADLLPGLIAVSFGMGMVFVAVTTAANAGIPEDKAGLAAALINASQQLGAALGLAVFSALASSRTNDLLADRRPALEALTSGFQRALLGASLVLVAAVIVALRTNNTRSDTAHAGAAPEPEHVSR
jgi:predicted MFS family arabinose efflux permease